MEQFSVVHEEVVKDRDAKAITDTFVVNPAGLRLVKEELCDELSRRYVDDGIAEDHTEQHSNDGVLLLKALQTKKTELTTDD